MHTFHLSICEAEEKRIARVGRQLGLHRLCPKENAALVSYSYIFDKPQHTMLSYFQMCSLDKSRLMTLGLPKFLSNLI